MPGTRDAVRQHHAQRQGPSARVGTAGGLALFLNDRAALGVGALLQVVSVVLLLTSPFRALREIPARAAMPPDREGVS